LGFIPQGGENFIFGDLRFTIAEMDGKRVARVKVERVKPVPSTTNDSETLPGKTSNSVVSRS
jgi:CBS domain containing-hemolysin-like protein